MLHLKVISGDSAGAELSARKYPVTLGRDAASQLVLTDAGVWDQHARIDLQRGQGFVIRTRPEAFVTLNAGAVQEAPLRNGDVIDVGAAKIQFTISTTRQKSLRAREWTVWMVLLLVAAAELWLIYNVAQ